MSCGCDRRAPKWEFESQYLKAQAPVILSIERRVCGCDYGSSSWTTRREADRIAAHLGLKPGVKLLELGAGSGWPGLYVADSSGCDVVLVDLPLTALRIAAQRAARDRLRGASHVVMADAAALPFPDASFDAVNQSDLLCCLEPKRAVLEACRRAIREDGRMVLTVIALGPHLPPEDLQRALEVGPDFVEAEAEYPALLEEAGWRLVERQDLTPDWADSCRRQIEVERELEDALTSHVGADGFAERQAEWRSQLAAIDQGLLRRELFVAEPVPA